MQTLEVKADGSLLPDLLHALLVHLLPELLLHEIDEIISQRSTFAAGWQLPVDIPEDVLDVGLDEADAQDAKARWPVWKTTIIINLGTTKSVAIR